MKRLFVLILFVAAASTGFSQNAITTFILVRHAEKMTDGSKDPELSEAGKKRAEALAELLAQTKLDAIYSTKFKRTEMTATPVAKTLLLSIQNYDGAKIEEINAMLQKHAGGTVLIVGHSNTTPGIINFLTGKSDYKNFDDSDYGNLVIISVTEKGKQVKVTWLRY
ncbi:MAG: histidine phosphatase family protein [Cyclobacteriaceae bacterium]|nr:histidine phosphatase family protein [Cyclobacteriaceae bacterium]